jgi:hypothetical protein
MGMQQAAVQIQVNADRTITVKLPDNLPIGEYSAVLVPVSQSNSSESNKPKKWDEKMNAVWEELMTEVEELPASPQPAQTEYHKSLIEKYRNQGLDL